MAFDLKDREKDIKMSKRSRGEETVDSDNKKPRKGSADEAGPSGIQKNKPLKGIKEIKYVKAPGVFGKSDKNFLNCYNVKHTLSSGKRVQVKMPIVSVDELEEHLEEAVEDSVMHIELPCESGLLLLTNDTTRSRS